MATEETTKTTTHKRGSKAAKRTETAVKASKTTKAAKSEKTAIKKAKSSTRSRGNGARATEAPVDPVAATVRTVARRIPRRNPPRRSRTKC